MLQRGGGGAGPVQGPLHELREGTEQCTLQYSTVMYIIRNNGILKFNSSVLPSSEGYISQYTP